MPNTTLEQYKIAVTRHIKRLERLLRDLDVASFSQYTDFINLVERKENKELEELERKKSDITTLQMHAGEVQFKLKELESNLKKQQEINNQLLNSITKINASPKNQDEELAKVGVRLRNCAGVITRIEQEIRSKRALLVNKETLIQALHEDIVEDKVDHRLVKDWLYNAKLLQHALRIQFCRARDKRLDALFQELCNTVFDEQDIIAKIRTLAEDSPDYRVEDLEDDEVVIVSKLLHVKRSILLSNLHTLVGKLYGFHQPPGMQFYNYNQQKNIVSSAITELKYLLDATSKQIFDVGFATYLPAFEKNAKETGLDKFKDEITAIQSKYHEKTSFLHYHDDYLILVNNTLTQLKEQGNKNLSSFIGLLTGLRSNLQKDGNILRHTLLANFVYDENLSAFLYKHWPQGMAEFDRSLFALESQVIGVEHDIDYDHLPIKPHSMEMKYKHLKKRYDIPVETDCDILNLMACHKQKQQQLEFLESMPHESPLAEDYLERLHKTTKSISDTIFKQITGLEIKYDKASDTILEYEKASLRYLDHLCKSLNQQLRKASPVQLQSLLQAINDNSNVIDEKQDCLASIMESLYGNQYNTPLPANFNKKITTIFAGNDDVCITLEKICAMKQTIAPLDVKTRDPLIGIGLFSELLESNKTLLCKRRDNALMKFLKQLGPLGKKIYDGITENKFFQQHLFFKVHGARFIKEVEKESARFSNISLGTKG